MKTKVRIIDICNGITKAMPLHGVWKGDDCFIDNPFVGEVGEEVEVPDFWIKSMDSDEERRFHAEWTDEDWRIAKQLWDAAADDGIIQADEMLGIIPWDRPELHSVQSIGSAFYALTGKDWDAEKAAKRFL